MTPWVRACWALGRLEYGLVRFSCGLWNDREAERVAFAGLSKHDEATVRAWLAGLAAPAPAARQADADVEEKS